MALTRAAWFFICNILVNLINRAILKPAKKTRPDAARRSLLSECRKDKEQKTKTKTNGASTAVTAENGKQDKKRQDREEWMLVRKKHLFLAGHTKPDLLNRYLSDFYSLHYMLKTRSSKLLHRSADSVATLALQAPLPTGGPAGLKSFNYLMLKQITKSVRKLKFSRSSQAKRCDEAGLDGCIDQNNNEVACIPNSPSNDSGLGLDADAEQEPPVKAKATQAKPKTKGIGTFRRREFFLRFLDFNFFIFL